MPIPDYAIEKVNEWLKAKIPGHHVCQVCGEQKWVVGELILASLIIPGACAAFVSIHCANCANVTLFDAGPMGIDPPLTAPPSFRR